MHAPAKLGKLSGPWLEFSAVFKPSLAFIPRGTDNGIMNFSRWTIPLRPVAACTAPARSIPAAYRQEPQTDSPMQVGPRRVSLPRFVRTSNLLYSNVFHLTMANFVEYGVPLPNLYDYPRAVLSQFLASLRMEGCRTLQVGFFRILFPA
jgi:hypothetical protein